MRHIGVDDTELVTTTEENNPAPSGSEKIVVGIDGSEGARVAIDWAISHARADDHIEIIHTWSEPIAVAEVGVVIDPRLFAEAAEAVLEAEMALVRDRRSDVHIDGRCVRGHSGTVLIDAAAKADMLVVGTRGRGGFIGLLLGSTSTYLAHHATCPLVIVPSSDR